MTIQRARTGAALLSLLLFASSLLSACTTLPDGGEDPVTDGESGGDLTLGEDTGVQDPVDTDATTAPPEAFVPSDTLVGDGVEAAGVYPTFSHKGGLYTETELSITLEVPEGYIVRYTTNGSTPNKSSGAYQGKAIVIKQSEGEATVIRAACFDADGKIAGQVITHTYVTVDETSSRAYTVMLTTDEKNLKAMYADVNAKVERAAHAEIISPDGTRVVSQDVGLRLFGGSSRSLAQKSFKIIARKDGYFGADTPYAGAGTFTYPFFADRVVLGGQNAGEVLIKYDSLILRNGGNDSLLSTAEDATNPTLLRDGLANEFVHHFATNVAASLSEFAVVYLNGEYYGILELRENQNEDYIKRLYGVDDNDVVVIKSELDTTRHCANHSNGGSCRFCGVWFYYETDEDAAAQAEMEDWIALCKKAAGAVNASDAQYKKVYDEVAAKVDLVNVKEYLALSCYLCNSDWPYNNVRLWRYTGPETEALDGKWRFATRDMDMAMGRYESPDTLPDLDNRSTVDMFEWVLVNYVDGYEDVRQSSFPDYPDALYLQGLFAFLLRDDTFRAEFADYCRMLASEESTAYMLEAYSEAFGDAKPLISDHVNRWEGNLASGYKPAVWQRACGNIKKFLQGRPEKFLSHLDRLLGMYE